MPAEPAAPPAKKKSPGKLIAFVAATLVAAGGAGGAAWYFLAHRGGDEEAVAQASNTALKPVFATLEPFTVNLLDDRGERFAQVGLTLEVKDSSVDVLIKDRLPAVRNQILLLISSKRIEDLLTPEGKAQLAQEVRTAAGRALVGEGKDSDNPVRAVLFSQFLVQ